MPRTKIHDIAICKKLVSIIKPSARTLTVTEKNTYKCRRILWGKKLGQRYIVMVTKKVLTNA